MKKILVISDIQADKHDPKLVKAVQTFCKDWQPDLLACVGDELDATSISKWVSKTRGEYDGSLQLQIDSTHSIMRGFREAAPNAQFVVQRSNHTTTRLQNYLNKAPAFHSLRSMHYPTLMRYDELDITVNYSPTPIAPGWVMVHGDEGGSSISAGGTALGLAKKIGKSVVCGHTHKQGLQHHNSASSGRINQYLHGFEAGHLMSMKLADVTSGGYLKFGGANWQAGFGLLEVSNNRTTLPTPVPIIRNTFIVNGVEYHA
jgi:predicted phosphodiesterase